MLFRSRYPRKKTPLGAKVALVLRFFFASPRLDLLFLQDGVWQDGRLLPEGWSKFVSTPAPGWAEPVYGGLFWINGNKELPLPENTYMMLGAGGQQTIIAPDLDLVIVRLGHFRGAEAGTAALARACEQAARIFKS